MTSTWMPRARNARTIVLTRARTSARMRPGADRWCRIRRWRCRCRARWRCVETRERGLRGVAADAGILNSDVVALRRAASPAAAPDRPGRGAPDSRRWRCRRRRRCGRCGLCRGERGKNEQRGGDDATQFSTPTIAPSRQVVSVPETIDLPPSEMMSARRSGAITVSPAIMMPSEPKLAKPHMA